MSDAKIQPAEFLVKSKVRALLKEADVRISEEAWDALGHQLTRAVKKATARAKANGRKTLRACDF